MDSHRAPQLLQQGDIATAAPPYCELQIELAGKAIKLTVMGRLCQAGAAAEVSVSEMCLDMICVTFTPQASGALVKR